MIDNPIRTKNNGSILTGCFTLQRRAIVVAAIALLVNLNIACSAEVSLTQLRQQTRQLLKSEANSEDHQGRQAAAMALCDMYVVLRSDRRYADSPMLQGDAAKVRKRLMRIADRNEARLNRAQVARPKQLTEQVDQALADIGKRNSSQLPVTNSQGTQQAVGGGGAPADEGWQLVELIQRVIAPDFWQAQGGPGVIRYFAIKRVLVVRATSDVHQQVRELLSALR